MEIEKNIIGSILTGNTEDISRLSAEDFIEYRHIASAIIELYANNLLFNGEQPNMREIAKRSGTSLVTVAELATYAEPLQYLSLIHISKCMNPVILDIKFSAYSLPSAARIGRSYYTIVPIRHHEISVI